MNDRLLLVITKRRKLCNLTEFFETEGSVSVVIAPSENGLKVLCSRIETVVLKIIDEITHADISQASADIVEGSMSLVLYVLQKFSPCFRKFLCISYLIFDNSDDKRSN
jgi:hypothetical protein